MKKDNTKNISKNMKNILLHTDPNRISFLL